MLPQSYLANTTGAILIGVVLSAVLYGITFLQVFSYYLDHSHADRKFLKGLVAVIMLFDTVHLGLLVHAVYWYTVTTYGDTQKIDFTVWSLIAQVGVGYVPAAIVQSYYAWRIYVISFRANRWLPAMIVICALGALASSFAFMIYTFRVPSMSDYQPALEVPPITFAVMELLADIMIMLGTVFYLHKGRRGHSSSFRSNLAISKLITYAARTGIPLNVFTILMIIVFISHQDDRLYVPFFFVLIRVYSCSFMTILNSRKEVRAVISAQQNTSGGDRPVPLMDVHGVRGVSGIQFAVETETDTSDDKTVTAG